jgi:hypothetical protein
VDYTVQDRLRTALVGELAVNLADQVFEACAERGIVLMPLKGVLLLRRWPALRGRRDLVDIDLLVLSSDVEALTLVLHALGFEPTVSSSARPVSHVYGRRLLAGRDRRVALCSARRADV